MIKVYDIFIDDDIDDFCDIIGVPDGYRLAREVEKYKDENEIIVDFENVDGISASAFVAFRDYLKERDILKKVKIINANAYCFDTMKEYSE